jgi:hypothetical protein
VICVTHVVCFWFFFRLFSASNADSVGAPVQDRADRSRGMGEERQKKAQWRQADGELVIIVNGEFSDIESLAEDEQGEVVTDMSGFHL